MGNVAAGKDTDDEGEALNDVEKTLTGYGIALRSSLKEWRSFEDVLEEIAAKWNEFSGTEQDKIATAIAGTRQRENFRALMNNWDEVGRLAGVAANSTGSATKRMETYLDSIEAKTNKLKASWENFVMYLNQSESWGKLLDMLSNFLDKLTYVDWDRVLKVIIQFGLLIAAVKGIEKFSGLVGTIRSITAMGAAGGGIASIISVVSGALPIILALAGAFFAVKTAIDSVNKSTEANLDKVEEQREALNKEEDAATKLIKRYNELKSKNSVYGLSQEEKQELVDVSTELVKVYGLEHDGIDSLTGAYNIATGAVDNYTESLKRQRTEFSKKAREERRKDIDNRLEHLSWNDTEFIVADTNRKLGKDFDADLYYSYTREREAVIGQIQNQMSEIFSDSLSESTRNMILNQINDNASNLTADEIKNKYTDGYLAQLNNFAEEYDATIKRVYESEEKYKKLIDKNGVLSLTDTEDYKKAIEDRIALYRTMQEQGLISMEEFQAQVQQIETEVNSRLDFALFTISEKLGENATKFKGVATEVLNLTTQLKQGEKGIQDYVTQLGELSKNLDLKEVFGENTEASLQFFSTLSTQLTNVLNLIKSNYESGVYASNNDYINDLIAWGEALQMVGNKMNTIEGKSSSENTNSVTTNEESRIATVNKDGQVTYIMEQGTYDQQQKNQNTLALIKGVWDGIVKNGEVDYETLQKLTGKFEIRNQAGYDYFYDKAIENFNKEGTRGISRQDFIDYFKDSNVPKEVVDQLAAAFEKEITLSTQEEKDALWKDVTNKYNLDNTRIVGNDPKLVEEYTNKINTLTNTLTGYQDRVKQIEENAKKYREKHPNKKLKNNGMTYAEAAEYEELQKKIHKTTEEIAEYQNKLDNVTSTEETFEGVVEETNAEIQEQGETTESSANQIAEAIKNLRSLQDSITAIEKINTGEIIEGTAEYSQAISTVIEDTVAQMRDASGNIKDNYKEIFGETSILYTGTLEEIQAAFQKGDITLEQFQKALKQEVQGNIDALKNGIGQFLIDIGEDFKDFEVTLKITMNTGNVVDKLKNAMAGLVGGEQNLGEIKISSDAISNTLSTLGNSIKNTPLEFDFSYVPTNTDTLGGGGGGTGGGGSYGGGGGKTGSEYTAADAASDLKDILQDIEGYEADIELDLEDQTEQFINQEMLAANRLDRLKEELDYYNDIYDVTEDTSKWLENQNKILGNLSDKVGELYSANRSIDAQRKELIDSNSQYDVASWFDSEGNDTLAYGNKLNEIEYQKHAIEQETAARMREVYNSVAGSTDKDTIQAAKDKIKQIEEEGDIRIEALDKEKEKIENIHDSVSELNDAWLDNQEAIRETLAELHETVNEIRDELLDDILEQLEKAVEEQNESIEKDVTRMEQLVTIQEQYNDILNETLDIQAELDSELQASLDSFEYLDEQMRQLMFNEEDYKKLSGTLTEIQEDIAYIWKDHYNQINALTDEEMYKAEYITAETERQLAIKMKEYELAKAELEVAKARTNLQNVQNERNVRMFVNGAWQWVADPNAVKDAQKQLADAEAAKEKIEREAEQQVYIDAMNKVIDNDNMQMDKNNELLEQVKKAIEEEKSEVKNIEQALANAEGQDLPALNDVLQGALGKDGGSLTLLLKELGRGQTELALALKGTTIAEAEDLLKSGTLSEAEFHELRKKLGYGWDEATGTIITQEDSWSAHYKGWKSKDDTNTPLHTGENGSSVTDNGQPATPTPAPAQPQPSNGFPRQGKVTTRSKNLNIRAGAGTNYKVLGSMPKGASVTITGEANGSWAAISYNGINGYASRQYLTYDQGGLATGKGIFLKDINLPERVLSPQQTKAFDTLVSNLTTNPVLMALTKNTTGTSNLNGLKGVTGETKQYYFSNFTVQADNISEFISSLDAMIPISEK